MPRSFALVALVVACGGAQRATSPTMAAGIFEVRVTGATIAPRRPDGSPWHVSSASSAPVVAGAAVGLAVGNPELGAKVGGQLADKGGDPQAPMPYVVLKLEGASATIGPAERTYSPRWNHPVEIRTHGHRRDERVILQVIDAVDNVLLAQGEVELGELVSKPSRTLTMLGPSVPALELEVSTKANSELDGPGSIGD